MKFFVKYLLVLVFCYIGFHKFSPIFYADSIIIDYGIHSFDICLVNPKLWFYLKIGFIFTYIFSSIFIIKSLFRILFPPKKYKKTSLKSKKIPNYFFNNSHKLQLLVGISKENNNIILPDKSLYQNILVTGTIGSGKTSSAMYPFVKQLISYESCYNEKKLGMLILDVKGNFYKKVLEYCKKSNRQKDLIVIELGGFYNYNPLDKPNLKAQVLANRLKTILTLFSENNSDSYWLDKVEQILTEAIKFCRIANNGYITIEQIHKLVTCKDYYYSQIPIVRNLFLENKLSKEDIYHLLSSITFFENEFFSLDERTLSILKSEITRITNCFVSDYQVLTTFCPSKDKINFNGFSDVLESGKIVVLNMNISFYQNLSKIIAAYLKLDFQTEVLNRLSSPPPYRDVAFISDEFHEYVTSSDANFFAQSREAKCINIVATQSYTSLLNTIKSEATVKVIIQNLVNKFWFRTDDLFTIEEAQKQIGKEYKKTISESVSENAKETVYSYFTDSLNSKGSNISQTISSSTNFDYIYDTNFFSSKLETFSALTFLSDGSKILTPEKISLIPYFKLD